jgi:hypothetical protein
MLTVLVFGSPGFADRIAWKQALCRRLGAAIAGAPELRLLTGGARGEARTRGGVDRHAALGARAALREPALRRRKVLTLAPADGAACVRCGELRRDAARDPGERREHLLAACDAVVTVEGGPGTRDLAERALARGRPLLPLGGTGGVSDELWHDADTRARLIAGLGLVPAEVDLLSRGQASDEELVACGLRLLCQRLAPVETRP